MSSATEFINNIKLISADSITKSVRESVNSDLDVLKLTVTKKELDIIDQAQDILAESKLTKSSFKSFASITKPLSKLVNKYYEEFNEKANCDIIDDTLSVDEVEVVVDKKVSCYQYSETNPMKGVSYYEARDTFQIQINGIKKSAKKIALACIKAKNILEEKDVKERDFTTVFNVFFFSYQDYYFICYQNDDAMFFDIQHVISVLNLSVDHSRKKYNEYSDKIVHCKWHQNEFGGYVLRELISRRTLFRIILSSNSTISKTFKDDVSEILDNLYDQGELEITNEKITIKKKHLKMDPVKNAEFESLNIIPYSYDSPDNLICVKKLVFVGSRTSISKYHDQHILYAFIIPLDLDHNDIVVKVGYTCDISSRIASLESEYKSKIYLIGIKVINNESGEKTFHKMIRNRYPHLKEEYKTGTKSKVELYKFNPIVIKMFNDYLKDIKQPEPVSKTLEIETAVRNQYESFLELILKKSTVYQDLSPKEKAKYIKYQEDQLHQYIQDSIEKEEETELEMKIVTAKTKSKERIKMAKIASEERVKIAKSKNKAKIASKERVRIAEIASGERVEKAKIKYTSKKKYMSKKK